MSKLNMPNTNEPFKIKRTGNNLGESIRKAAGGNSINNPLNGVSSMLNKAKNNKHGGK
jgi:hypothetical protein